MNATTEIRKYDLDRTVRLGLTVATVGVGVWLLNYLSGILLPFVVGCLLAYMLDPVVRFFMKVFRTKRRMLPAIVTMLLLLLALYLICYYLIPYLIDEFIAMGKMLTTYVTHQLNATQMPDWLAQFINAYFNPDDISHLFSKEQWLKIANHVLIGTVSVLDGTLAVITAAVSWLLALLYMFFVLLDYDTFGRGIKSAIPPRYRRMVFRIFNDVMYTMGRYFRGQALVSLFVGIIFAVEFSIIGLPLAVVFGLCIGVLNMVPYLQLVSIPFAAFLCAVASVATGQPFWTLATWTVLAYVICQIIQDVVLIPLIMRSQMGLSPAIVFLALAVWSYVLGFIGLIIALPLTTLLIGYWSEFILHTPRKRRGR